ncbi:MAG: radical SAM protein [Methanimicrococcus sp.]|nr:radical SAM protein [Methanimicrococcus sp.]
MTEELKVIRPDESGSYSRFLTDGCLCCREGAKMVLFVTGRCYRDCFFCPLSVDRKNADVIFANERPVYSDADILDEARTMRAKGTGITGGEPLLELPKVLRYISLLKSEFGKEHHIHMYTSEAPDEKQIKALANAGLNEIRFHPPYEIWIRLEESPYKNAVFSA